MNGVILRVMVNIFMPGHWGYFMVSKGLEPAAGVLDMCHGKICCSW